VDGVGTSEEVFSRLLADLWPRIPADRITQLAGVSEPVPTAPADAGPRHSRSPASHSSVRCGRVRLLAVSPRRSRAWACADRIRLDPRTVP
jgi:hypothetical protein